MYGICLYLQFYNNRFLSGKKKKHLDILLEGFMLGILSSASWDLNIVPILNCHVNSSPEISLRFFSFYVFQIQSINWRSAHFCLSHELKLLNLRAVMKM